MSSYDPGAEITKRIQHPGNVHINVQGAFIIDGAITPPDKEKNDAIIGEWMREDKDIRLPNHRSVVSHIAVDVSSAHSIHCQEPRAAAT